MMASNDTNNPNWFIDKLTYYQAANSSNEAIKQNFLIRIDEFQLIINDLRSKKLNDPLQHSLILGRRGSGKSTLLRRIQVEIEEDKALSEQFVAINLAEEQAGIYRLSDLWFEVLQELMSQLNAKKTLRDFDTFDEPQGYTRYLYAEIHQLLQTHKKRVVLLLDNLDRILENFNNDGHLLREILLNYNDLQIIGGSTRMSEHFWRYDKPFYDFFKRYRLESLSFEEIHHLLNHWGQAMDLPVLHDYALRFRGKIEAIRILTDGLPRALQFFIQILLHDSTLYGFDYLRKIMDKATPLYQERLNNLTPPERKIVLEMAFWWEACPTKVLVEKCRMEGKTISAYLKKLEKYGIVETISTPTKNHLYRVSERFFNMWLIVTQGNPEQKRHAKYLTLFLETWYDAQDLKGLATAHIKGLKTGNFSYDKALILSKAFSQSRYIGVKERDALIDLTLKLKGNDGGDSELPRKYADILKEINKLMSQSKYDEALERLNEIENEEDGVKFNIEGYLYIQSGRNVEAEKSYLKAIDRNNELVEAICSLAIIYHFNGDKEKGESYFLQAARKGDSAALYILPTIYYAENRKKKEALELFSTYTQLMGQDYRMDKTIIYEIWNSVFDNLDTKIEQFFKESNHEGLTWFLENLLYLHQTYLVLSLFESETHGKALKTRYELLYYATLILMNKTEGNLLLKIPPEVLPTVEAIVADVKEKQAFYAQTTD